MLATYGALNIAFTTGIIACCTGASTAQAILIAAGAADTVMALFLAAVSVYHGNQHGSLPHGPYARCMGRAPQ